MDSFSHTTLCVSVCRLTLPPWLENSVSLFLAWRRTLSLESPLRHCRFLGAISGHPPFPGVIISLFNLLTMLDAHFLIVFHAVDYGYMFTFCLRSVSSYSLRAATFTFQHSIGHPGGEGATFLQCSHRPWTSAVRNDREPHPVIQRGHRKNWHHPNMCLEGVSTH